MPLARPRGGSGVVSLALLRKYSACPVALSEVLELERHIIVAENHFLDIFVKPG